MKVVAFNGSPRRSGNTATLLKVALAELEAAGVRTELVQLGGLHLYGCRACYGCASKKDGRCAVQDDELNSLIEKLLDADGVLIGTPTYFTDVTAEVKAFIDRAGLVTRVNGNLMRHKLGAAVVAVRRAGSLHAFDTINHFFLISEMLVVGSSYWNMGFGHDKGEVKDDDEGIATMATLGRNMAWALAKLGG